MRFALLYATFVAGPLSVVFLMAPASAQQPGLPPGGARPVGPAPTAVAPAGGGTSVAVIDIAYIFKNHARFNAQMKDMKADIDAFDGWVRDTTQKMQKKAEGAASFAPTSDQFKKIEEELAHEKSNVQIEVGKKRKEFLEAEAKVYYGIYREVEDAVADFAQKNGIRLVLRFNGDDMKADDRNSVLQGVNKPVVYQYQLDITLAILNKLNAGMTVPPGGGAAPGIQPSTPVPQGTQISQPPVRGPIVPGQPARR